MFKLFFTFFFLYICFVFFGRYVLPFILSLPFVLRHLVKKTHERTQGNGSNQRTYNTSSSRSAPEKKNVGEYIDYEEVK